MRQMKKGQMAFFYHSNCKEPGIAGLMKAGPASVPLTLPLDEILNILPLIVLYLDREGSVRGPHPV